MFNKFKIKYSNLPLQVKASFWFLICAFMQKGISTITTPIFTRLLTTEEYGKYNVFNSWFSILSIFITLSIYNGVFLQGLVKFDKEKYVYASSLQGLTFTLVVVWSIIYCISSSFWNHLFGLTSTQMIALIILSWTTAVYGFWAAEQRVEYNYIKLVIVTVTVSIAKPILSIFLIFISNDNVTARIMGILLAEFCGYIWLFFDQLHRGKTFFSKKFWLYALRLAIPLVPHYLSANILNSSDRIMIQILVSDSAAGKYSLAYSISQVMTLFNSALIQAITPWYYQKIKDKHISDIKKVAYPALFIIASVNIALIAFAPEIISLFAPKEYYEAIYVIPPIAMSTYFMFSYDLFCGFEFYYERTKYIATATAIAAVVNIISNYVFIRFFGYYAAGYTTLACYILFALVHYLFMRKLCKQYHDGDSPFNFSIIVFLSLIFLMIGFIFTLTYEYIFLRFAFILFLIILLLCMRNRIKNFLLNVFEIKNQSS